jgi:ferric-dicitrate binding protein FerR (iron transport regulator)
MGFLLALAASPQGCSRDPQPPPPAAQAAPAVKPLARAKLRGLRGEVTVKRAAGDEWTPVTEGQELFENDKVRTAKGAGAVLEFANGTTAKLDENALIGIAETAARSGEATDVTLLRGRIDAEMERDSNQSLSVSTPSATVRGGREIVFQ